MKKLLAIPLIFEPQEIITSWLSRIALVHGCDPLVLTWEIWPGWRIWTLDADRWIEPDKLIVLSSLSGIELYKFQEATLRPYATIISKSRLPKNNLWPWILTIGSRNTKRQGGMQFCPACLKNDPKPYYRIHWRFAWHTVCRIHDCNLMDRCQSCNAPIELARLKAQDKHLGVCASCKTMLSKISSTPSLPELRVFQGEADQVLHNRHGSYDGQSIKAHAWFNLLKFFIGYIRRASNRKAKSFHKLADDALKLSATPEISKISGTEFETLQIHDRQWLLHRAWKFMNMTREELKDHLCCSGVTKQSFLDKNDRPPHLLQDICDSLQNNPWSKKKKQNPKLPGPRSINEVKRMMVKIERRVELAKR